FKESHNTKLCVLAAFDESKDFVHLDSSYSHTMLEQLDLSENYEISQSTEPSKHG
ncbi:hypothetical protein CHUAL_007321, partial [Chamberlinius hualienensis]